ncbi:MAG TPA: hypothetical protein PKA88_27565, partial [Polyangiaceae bacterium]|nr:hypothetical protein [Polyangiaceae bacterium]
ELSETFPSGAFRGNAEDRSNPPFMRQGEQPCVTSEEPRQKGGHSEQACLGAPGDKGVVASIAAPC